MPTSKDLVFYSWIPLSPEVSRLSPYTRTTTYANFKNLLHIRGTPTRPPVIPPQLTMAEEHGSVTSSSIEPTIQTDEKEVNEEDAFVPETQVDAVDYIDISSDVDTVLEMQMDLDSDSLTKPLDRY